MDQVIAVDGWPQPAAGWPEWAFTTPYVGAAHPQQPHPSPVEVGANCQRYAYSVLKMFGRNVPNHRSSELWADPTLPHPGLEELQDLDLVLFNADDSAWGAHVTVLMNDQLLHLSAEVGHPAVWDWIDFTQRDHYATIIGAVRVPVTNEHDAGA